MKIFSISGPVNIINPENSLEREILSAKVTNSKICYRVDRNTNKSSRELTIRLVDHGSSWISFKKKFANLKIFPNDFERSSYVIRLTLDAFSINNGYLPLHGASLIVKEKMALLFGDSFCGKSTVMHHYCSTYPGVPVGDDHVIIGNNRIVGNKIIRLKNPQFGERFIARKMKISSFSEYLIFVVKLSNKNYCKKVSASELLRNYSYQEYVLKYFYGELKENNNSTPLSKLVDVYLEDDYQRRFVNLVENSSSIYFLSGRLNFILEKIKAILTNS